MPASLTIIGIATLIGLPPTAASSERREVRSFDGAFSIVPLQRNRQLPIPIGANVRIDGQMLARQPIRRESTK